MRSWSRTTTTGRMRTRWSVTWPVSWWQASRTRLETRSVIHSPHPNTHSTPPPHPPLHAPTPIPTHTSTPSGRILSYILVTSIQDPFIHEVNDPTLRAPTGIRGGGDVKMPCFKVCRGYKLLYVSRLLLIILMCLESWKKSFQCFF